MTPIVGKDFPRISLKLNEIILVVTPMNELIVQGIIMRDGLKLIKILGMSMREMLATYKPPTPTPPLSPLQASALEASDRWWWFSCVGMGGSSERMR
jgi:hypothetical protein